MLICIPTGRKLINFSTELRNVSRDATWFLPGLNGSNLRRKNASFISSGQMVAKPLVLYTFLIRFLLCSRINGHFSIRAFEFVSLYLSSKSMRICKIVFNEKGKFFKMINHTETHQFWMREEVMKIFFQIHFGLFQQLRPFGPSGIQLLSD